MATYRYKAISADGTEVKGSVKADSEQDAITKLRTQYSAVTRIEKVPEFTQKESSQKKIRIKDKDLAIICSQLSIILGSGMPVVQCVEMVAEQTADPDVKAALLKVADDIDGGYTMAESFERNLPGLPTTFIETVRAGEQSGTLEMCFDRLHKYYDRRAKTKGKVVGALIYPAIVILVAIIVFVIIMVVAVPLFKDTFEQLGVELPWITKFLIGISDFFVNYWWVLCLILGVLAVVYYFMNRTEEGKLALSKFSITKAPLHDIRIKSCSDEFSSTMSTMISAGLPLTDSLEVTSNVIGNYAFASAVKQVGGDVEQGRGLADSMRNYDVFPKLLVEMTGVGEQAGSLEETLDVVSDYYSNDVQLATDRLLSIMEPVITIGLAVITVVLLLAVYLPMFSMYSSI